MGIKYTGQRCLTIHTAPAFLMLIVSIEKFIFEQNEDVSRDLSEKCCLAERHSYTSVCMASFETTLVAPRSTQLQHFWVEIHTRDKNSLAKRQTVHFFKHRLFEFFSWLLPLPTSRVNFVHVFSILICMHATCLRRSHATPVFSSHHECKHLCERVLLHSLLAPLQTMLWPD